MQFVFYLRWGEDWSEVKNVHIYGILGYEKQHASQEPGRKKIEALEMKSFMEG